MHPYDADDAHRNAILDVKMPSAILDELRTVDALVRQLDEDITQSRTRAEFKRAWATFREEWERFFDDHQSWMSRTWYAVWEKTRDYRRRVKSWRAAFIDAGGTPSAPEDVIKDDSLTKYLLITAGVVGVGLAGWALLRRRAQKAERT
jgi:hypothetical protein